jgi:hypothetical protein
MESIFFSETPIDFPRTAPSHISEDMATAVTAPDPI